MTRLVCIALLFAPLQFAADPALPAGAKPKNEGSVGAGEGPVWHPSGNLYFSGRNRITRRDAAGGIHIFREPSGSNGLLFDLQGRLVVCESGGRRIARTEPDGSITVLAEGFEGKRFNTPNDLTMDSRGRIYFTDPRYGNRDDMEMRDGQGRLIEGVYRIDAPGKVARIVTHEVDRPNGILVSPKDEFLYIADNNNNTVGGARKLWRFGLKPDGTIDAASRKLIFDWENGRGPDGVKMDRKGRLYVAGGLNKPHPPYESADKFKGGVYILSPEGKLLDFIAIPVDEVTNCAFGGADLKTLFITAGGTLWSIPVTTPGRIPFTDPQPLPPVAAR
ncbi:MAG: SMP-30/gluconolactonase/LRE family protein [Bryobacteraceae bacterium]